jgi:hypothetical protein
VLCIYKQFFAIPFATVPSPTKNCTCILSSEFSSRILFLSVSRSFMTSRTAMDCGGPRRWGLTALAACDLRARPQRWPGLSGGAQRLHQRATLRSDLDRRGGGVGQRSSMTSAAGDLGAELWRMTLLQDVSMKCI